MARFLISTEVEYLQHWHGWCPIKLLPSRRVLCTPYNHAPCHFMQSQIRKVYACCNLPPAQNDRGLVRATAVTRTWNRYRRNKSQHRTLTPGEENSPTAPQCTDSNLRPFDHKSGALTIELSPLVILTVFFVLFLFCFLLDIIRFSLFL